MATRVLRANLHARERPCVPASIPRVKMAFWSIRP